MMIQFVSMKATLAMPKNRNYKKKIRWNILDGVAKENHQKKQIFKAKMSESIEIQCPTKSVFILFFFCKYFTEYAINLGFSFSIWPQIHELVKTSGHFNGSVIGYWSINNRLRFKICKFWLIFETFSLKTIFSVKLF